MSAEQKKFRVFKSHIASCQYITSSGKYLYFTQGKHITDNEVDIAELEKEVANKHPHIYIDSKEAEVTAAYLSDPLADLKKKAVQDFLAANPDLAVIANANKDFGNSGTGAGEGAGLGNTHSAPAGMKVSIPKTK